MLSKERWNMWSATKLLTHVLPKQLNGKRSEIEWNKTSEIKKKKRKKFIFIFYISFWYSTDLNTFPKQAISSNSLDHKRCTPQNIIGQKICLTDWPKIKRLIWIFLNKIFQWNCWMDWWMVGWMEKKNVAKLTTCVA